MIAADVVLALLYTLSLDKVHFTSEHVLQLILHIHNEWRNNYQAAAGEGGKGTDRK
ncbi:MAG: hypothetical protein HY801_03555 [Candidatus Lindowbacteria bacterium]|nr:hypothetical protein [Candidatus Lindowbacteria bacterium]